MSVPSLGGLNNVYATARRWSNPGEPENFRVDHRARPVFASLDA
jgi:hypothetical protein